MNEIAEKIRKYIADNLNQDVNKLVLKGCPFEEVSIEFLVNQIEARKRLKKKLPSWIENQKIIFPPLINLAQTSSEITANYKSKLLQGESIIDLTGGFGVDAYYLAKKFKKVFHLEHNAELSELAKYNSALMAQSNIDFLNQNSIDFLKYLTKKVDCIYVDPSRRNEQKRKVFQLKDCSPDLIENWSLIASKTKKLLIKTSPILDLKLGLKQLSKVVEIHIVSVKNEVKELLWIIDFEALQTNEAKIKCIDFNGTSEMTFEGNFTLEDKAESIFSPPQKYLYEPMSSIMKSGLFNLVSRRFKLKKLDINTHLYTSDKHIENFSGKVFEINEVMTYKTKAIKKRLKSMKLNVVKRNFPILVKDLISKFKIEEGGENFVFFTTYQEKKIVILCKRIH